MSDQVKFYKNKHRNAPEQYQKYVPQHTLLGVEPQEMNFSNRQQEVQHNVSNKLVVQPYANINNSPIGADPIPNVGNSMEHTWSALDGEIIDDLNVEMKPGHKMIDNNDFVTPNALVGTPSFGANQRNRAFPIPALQDEVVDDRPTLTDIPVFKSNESELLSIVNELKNNQYLILVKGEAICSGPLAEIEEAASALIFGNHVLLGGEPVPEEDIIILKKVPIKVGVFLDKE